MRRCTHKHTVIFPSVKGFHVVEYLPLYKLPVTKIHLFRILSRLIAFSSAVIITKKTVFY